MTIRSESPEVGEAEIRMPIEYEGEEVQIGFNPEYLEDMLAVVERESVKLEFTDSGSPCTVRSGYDFTYVISPGVREEGLYGPGGTGGAP